MQPFKRYFVTGSLKCLKLNTMYMTQKNKPKQDTKPTFRQWFEQKFGRRLPTYLSSRYSKLYHSMYLADNSEENPEYLVLNPNTKEDGAKIAQFLNVPVEKDNQYLIFVPVNRRRDCRDYADSILQSLNIKCDVQ